MGFLLIYVTHPDENTSHRIAQQLLEEKLVACANHFPITSAYWWQGAIQHENEWVSILKTMPSRLPALQARIRSLHPYQTPCILHWEVAANTEYAQWIGEQVK